MLRADISDNIAQKDHLLSILSLPGSRHNQEVPCLQVSARQAVVETLESVFARHGAVPMDSSDIGFCPVDAPSDIAALLSTTGARLAMR